MSYRYKAFSDFKCLRENIPKKCLTDLIEFSIGQTVASHFDRRLIYEYLFLRSISTVNFLISDDTDVNGMAYLLC